MTQRNDPAVLDEQPQSNPTLLYSTPDGFEDGDGNTYRELVARLVELKRCETGYRLLLDVGGKRFRLDAPHGAMWEIAQAHENIPKSRVRLTADVARKWAS